MRIVISDYENVMESDYNLTIDSIKEVLPDAEIEIVPYEAADRYFEKIRGANGLITAFLTIDESFLQRVPNLEYISISAAGYDNVNLNAAKAFGVTVCHIEEYCTNEVAEHTLSLMLALNRNLKHYEKDIEEKHLWQFYSTTGSKPLSSQTLAIFGFGRIGKQVASYLKGFCMNILVVDPYITKEEALKYGVKAVSAKEAFSQADIITNHMNITEENKKFFNHEAFHKMKKKPLFLNMGRGACVDEEALLYALKNGLIRGAGLDVLESEEPILKNHPLVGLRNVIITPHSGFYSEESIKKLQTISAKNLAYCLSGEYDKVKKIVSVSCLL